MSFSDSRKRPRSLWWWYRRFRRAYANHAVEVPRGTILNDAKLARRSMPVAEQWKLQPLKKRRPDVSHDPFAYKLGDLD